MKSFLHNTIKLFVLMLIPLSVHAQDQDLLFTGRVFSQKAQGIFVPLTNNWQARISMMLPEGTQVRPGDVAVEFDGSEAARQLEQLMESQRTEQAKTERDIAMLQKELNAAEFQLQQSRVDLDLAELKAGIGVSIILDALPDLQLEGRLHSISDSGARRSEWGEGLYYEGVVSFESAQANDLLPGMSALVEPRL